MGWMYEGNHQHEGYPVAIVRSAAGWLELGVNVDDVPPERIHVMQVACDCGWRSRRYFAPLTAVYSPHSLDLGDPAAEAEARAIWARHCREEEEDDFERGRGYGAAAVSRARLFPCTTGPGRWGDG